MMSKETSAKSNWEAESTHPEETEIIRDALREVMDPELGLSIIELGLIRQLAIREGQAELTMILTTPYCPYAPAIMEMARSKTESALGLPVKITLSMEAWDPSMMEEGSLADWGLF